MSQKICVVIGVGEGLGFAIARRFGLEGYHLAIMARRSQALVKYQKMLEQDKIESNTYSVDVADAKAVSDAFTHLQQTIGIPEVLVYNAAALRVGDPFSMTADDLINDFKVNVAGALTAVQHAVPGMRQLGHGTILLTGGGLALEPSPQVVSLSIGKAAIRNFGLSLAKQLEEANIHVASVTICGNIAPGTHFAPDAIAQIYWQLHSQPREQWQSEYVYQ
jgi:short-subunit dehydrogenase